jgi:hypothetical protein
MNKQRIKHLLQIGMWQKWKKKLIDATTVSFYMAGPNIVSEEDFKDPKFAVLPKIATVPPDEGDLWSDIDSYWYCAACIGPIDMNSYSDLGNTFVSVNSNGITTLPFSYRPWKLRYISDYMIKLQMYAIAIIIMRHNATHQYKFEKQLLIMIYKHLLVAPGVNRGFHSRVDK